MPKMPEKIGTSRCSDTPVRNLITEVIKRSGMKRLAIAEKLSLHVGQPISKRMLDDWTAESKKRARFPACFVQAFCEITNSDQLQRHLLSDRLRRLLSLGESVETLLSSEKRDKAVRSNQ
jgi:hypothetical protein